VETEDERLTAWNSFNRKVRKDFRNGGKVLYEFLWKLVILSACLPKSSRRQGIKG
jgi:hypothetical protein